MILKFNYRAENENTKIMIDETIPKFRGVANEVKSLDIFFYDIVMTFGLLGPLNQ